jgi:hypothetical protein
MQLLVDVQLLDEVGIDTDRVDVFAQVSSCPVWRV